MATAKYWGLLPHVVWHYPFRYYKELRDFYFSTLSSADVPALDDKSEEVFEFDAEIFRGDAL